MHASSNPPPVAKPGMPLRWTYAILILAFLFVLMPFLFWRATWFGRPLTEDELAKNFADLQHPRKIQHALAQVGDRIARNDQSVHRWYPQVAAQASSPVHELRTTAAWVMGQDNTVPEFHQALLALLRDAHPMVRRNAALALVRFADPSGHDEILALLQPYELPAPAAGTLDHRLQPGDVVNPGTLIGHLRAGETETEIRCEVPGTLDLAVGRRNHGRRRAGNCQPVARSGFYVGGTARPGVGGPRGRFAVGRALQQSVRRFARSHSAPGPRNRPCHPCTYSRIGVDVSATSAFLRPPR